MMLNKNPGISIFWWLENIFDYFKDTDILQFFESAIVWVFTPSVTGVISTQGVLLWFCLFVSWYKFECSDHCAATATVYQSILE